MVGEESRGAACHTNPSQSECRLHHSSLLREVGGNDRADGAGDITNLIISSLSSALATSFYLYPDMCRCCACTLSPLQLHM